MFSIAVVEPGKLKVVDIPTPEIGPYDVIIKNKVATLCNATDRKLIQGHFPGVNNYPLLLGHETAGEVIKTGSQVRNFSIGEIAIGGLLLNPTDPKYFSGWGGFSEFTIIKDHKAMKKDDVADKEHGWNPVNKIQLPVKDDIPIEAAVMLCTWREVYAGLEDFGIRNNVNINSVLVFGAGPVGISFLKLLKLKNIDYLGVVDPLKNKRELALEMGADEVFKPEDNLNSIFNRKRGKLDIIIDAVGKEEIINQSLPLIKMAGDICVYGVIDKPQVNIKKDDGPYNFNLLFHQWPTRNREAAAQEPLIDIIKENKLDFEDFITTEYSIKEIRKAFNAANSGDHLKVLLRY